jgi:hypothetical protein
MLKVIIKPSFISKAVSKLFKLCSLISESWIQYKTNLESIENSIDKVSNSTYIFKFKAVLAVILKRILASPH